MAEVQALNCPYCGEKVHVSDFWQPVKQVERDATEHDPRSFVIIGAGHLLHRCEIGEEHANE